MIASSSVLSRLERRFFGAIGASQTWSLFLHFAAANCAMLSWLSCIVRRTTSVVRVLPCNSCPINPFVLHNTSKYTLPHLGTTHLRDCTIKDGMRKSRLIQSKQDKLIKHFVAATMARCVTSLFGMNNSTAAYYFHRLREIIVHQTADESNEAFGGQIELEPFCFYKPACISEGRQAKTSVRNAQTAGSLVSLSVIAASLYGGRTRLLKVNTAAHYPR